MARRHRERSLPREVAELKKRMESWRARKRSGERIPAEFWNSAVSLAEQHGIGLTARELSLEFSALKKRVAESGRGDEETTAGGGGFVELDVEQLLGAPGFAGTVVELCRPDGAQMVIRMGQGETVDVTRLATAFYGRVS